MFAYNNYNQNAYERMRTRTYPFDISMNYIARMKVTETFGNTKQLGTG